MDFFSHLLIGILISIFLLNSLGKEFVIYASIMAFLPDFDAFLELFQSFRKSKLLSHKGVSHSYLAAFFVSMISGSIFFLLTGESFVLAWMIGFLFYSIHISLDALTASKIPLFYPFSKKRFRIFVDRAINLFLAIISVIFLILYFAAFFFLPELYFYNLAFSFLIFYIVYLIYKIYTKISVQLRLSDTPSRIMIPGILPFVYLIYENNSSDTKLSFKLLKKFQLISKTVKIIETEIKTDSEEMDFYNKAKSLSKKYPFFFKWEAIIPIILKDEKLITVVLFLAESFAFGSAHSLRVVFNKKSKEAVYESNGFGYAINNMLNKPYN
ncbi:MAG: metal-dependent hydrolase [Promethearchaeota archaeon]